MAYEFQDSIQRGLLYLCKSSPNFFVQANSMIKPQYFEFPSHQKIYTAISSYHDKYNGVPTDDQLLEGVKVLKAHNELLSDYVDELSQINDIEEKAIENEEYYLDKVEHFAKEQSIKEAIIDSVDLLKRGKFEQIETKIREALSINRNVDLGIDYFGDIEGRWEKLESERKDSQYRTPFAILNEALDGGLAKKELAMVVAPPGVGKSLFLANQAVRSVLDGHNVVYISLEMAEARVAQRFDSIFTRIKQHELPHRIPQIKDRLGEITGKVSNHGKLRIKEFPTKRLTSAGIRAYLNQLKNYEGFVPDVIVLDYLELMSTDAQMPEYQSQERLAQEIRGLATEYSCLVWTATQTNREGKRVNIITDSELADSYGKIRVCDLVFSINQSSEEFDEGTARLYVMKSRNGKARFIIPVAMDYSRLVISQGQN